MKVLIVGDSQSRISLIENYLEDDKECRISTVLTNNHLEDKDYCTSYCSFSTSSDFDMIIMSVKNYCMSEMLHRLQSINYNYQLEEVALLLIVDTAEDLPREVQQTFAIFDYIMAPVSKVELLSRVRIHKQYKKQIKQHASLKSRILEATANAMALTDTNGRLLWVNPAFTKLTGYTKHEVLGKNTSFLKSGKQEPLIYEQLWGAIAAGDVWRGELINRRKNGTEYYEEMTITPLADDNGQVSHYIAIKQDVTERRQREEQLLRDALIAKQVQKGALSQAIVNDKIHIEGMHMNSMHLSGDMYAWYEIADNEYGIILYDVMGHGLSSALITMSIRSLLRGIITKARAPEIVLRELNRHIYSLVQDNESFSGFYFTAIYLAVNTKTREIQYVNAGNPPAFLIDQDERILLDKGCPPCGVFPNLKIEQGIIQYNGPTKICLYTDGLLGAVDSTIEKSITMLGDELYDYRNRNNQDTIRMICNLINKDRVDDDICFISVSIP